MENGISDGTNHPDGAIIRGNPDGALNPQGSATRAELAAVWMRLIQNVVK